MVTARSFHLSCSSATTSPIRAELRTYPTVRFRGATSRVNGTARIVHGGNDCLRPRSGHPAGDSCLCGCSVQPLSNALRRSRTTRHIQRRPPRWVGTIDRCEVTRCCCGRLPQKTRCAIVDDACEPVEIALDRCAVRVSTRKMRNEMLSHLLKVVTESFANDLFIKRQCPAQQIEGVAVEHLLLAIRRAHAIASTENQLRIQVVIAALEVAAIRNLAQEISAAEHLPEGNGRSVVPGE